VLVRRALDVLGEPLAGRLAVEPAVLPEVDEDAVVGERRLAHVRRVRDRLAVPVVGLRRDDRPDLDAHLRRERVVALVVRGHRHQRARPHVREDEVGDEDGDLLARGRVRGGQAGLDAVRLVALGVGLVVDELVDRVVLGGQLLADRVVRGEREERRAVDGVDAGGERLDGAVAVDVEIQRRPVLAGRSSCAASDAPSWATLQVVDGLQQLVGVLR